MIIVSSHYNNLLGRENNLSNGKPIRYYDLKYKPKVDDIVKVDWFHNIINGMPSRLWGLKSEICKENGLYKKWTIFCHSYNDHPSPLFTYKFRVIETHRLNRTVGEFVIDNTIYHPEFGDIYINSLNINLSE